ncbi:MAG TPA: FHA domain-containing protein [Streptosporangiaceae bacterium]|nr:FHA domain-containing protein [Streptosporangiaceae bacterium]
MKIEPALSPGDQPLHVRAQGSDRMLQAGPSYRIGRDPDSDIVVADPRVSWQHAVLRQERDHWLLEDSGSTNGTFLGAERVQRVTITGDCQVRLGHPDDGPEVTCSLDHGRQGGQHGTQIAEPPAPRPAGDQAAAAPAPPQRQAPPPQPQPQARPQPQAPPPQARPQPQPRAQPQQDRAAAGARVSQAPSRPPSAVMRLPTTVMKIGRAADNDVVVADLSVSRYHAELKKGVRGTWEIVDLGSHNGTFLNGQRVNAAPVADTDLIGVGPATFQLVGDQLQEFIDTGDISLAARDLTVTLPSGRVLLDHVSFPLGERCLLGVIGPSGAGKSTLLGALTGLAPAGAGGVLYDNRDLYTHYAELRHRIGLVPQENILHTQLTAERGLGYAAELRFPGDVSKAERKRRIGEVLDELALTKHAQTRISAMSGGQQKRVNVALELLTKPSLLFLDEPTSGLDPGLDKSVMEQMADLAHDGRTVIVVTHSVANLNLCDRLLVLAAGGKIAYFGPPDEGLRHFGKAGWAEVFQAFDAEPDRDWAAEYKRSPYYQRYIASDMDAHAPVAGGGQAEVSAPHARNKAAQLSTLIRRYVAVVTSDRGYLAVLAIMPLLLGILGRFIPAPQGLTGKGNSDAASLLLILVISACFTGAANSVRELVKERSIYTRERAAGQSAGAYLLSKLVILGIISAIQAVVLVGISLPGKKMPPTGSFLTHLPLVELLLAIGVLAIASMTLGLFISVLVNSSDKTMPLLVVLVMFQVILTGGIFPLAGKAGINQVSYISPSRWGFAATASTANLNVIQQPADGGQAAAITIRTTSHLGSKHPQASGSPSASASDKPGGKKSGSPSKSGNPGKSGGSSEPKVATDPLWRHTSSTWLTDVGMMLVLGLLFSLITWWRLVRIRPGRRQ